ncbi:serine protease snake isoform X3 [Manduca sexta]|uniref:serine protease snake isoform X3 n=1 Tax=Manduca sexta TaxID=7130 RepID=UPI00188E08A9|nr:serine protease snake isoform X3 [Manduca sexta]
MFGAAPLRLMLALCALASATHDDGVFGTCVNIVNCPSAVAGIHKSHKMPKICRFEQMEPIVCCFDNVRTSTATTFSPKSFQEPTTIDDYDYYHENIEEKTCKPVPPELTAPRTGQKAWDTFLECLEYQEKLVYPCEMSQDLSSVTKWERRTKCYRIADGLIVGGKDAAKNEFSHMALLGYGKGSGENIHWLCGGSLISDKFILTAGHCIADRIYGVVTFAYLNLLNRSEIADNSPNKYGIKTIIKHPGYQSPNKYNDIALLELDRRVHLDEYTVPACLPVSDHMKDDVAMATGWGLTAYEGSTSNALQKVNLTKFTLTECEENFPPSRNMRNGYDAATQTCYGDRIEAKDTCQGDSGGPLQIVHDKIRCMYVIVGITSSGYACGFEGQPGLYTRVSHYVPWIESVLWP